jgi:hypothetical protein
MKLTSTFLPLSLLLTLLASPARSLPEDLSWVEVSEKSPPAANLPHLDRKSFQAGETGRYDARWGKKTLVFLRVPLPPGEDISVDQRDEIQLDGRFQQSHTAALHWDDQGISVVVSAPPGKSFPPFLDLMTRPQARQARKRLRLTLGGTEKPPHEISFAPPEVHWKSTFEVTRSGWKTEGQEGGPYYFSVDFSRWDMARIPDQMKEGVYLALKDSEKYGPVIFKRKTAGWVSLGAKSFFLPPNWKQEASPWSESVRDLWLFLDRQETVRKNGARAATASEKEWHYFRLPVELARGVDPDQLVLSLPSGVAYPEGVDAEPRKLRHSLRLRPALRRREKIWFFGRTKQPRETFTLHDLARSGPRAVLRSLHLPSQKGELGPLKKGFLRAEFLAAERMSARFPGSPVLRARARATAQKAGEAWRLSSPGNARRGPQRVDLYSAFSGALAIQESLQLDQVLNPGKREEARTVSIADLTGPNLTSIDFKTLGSNLPAPVLWPMDSVIPADLLYLHFPDLRSLHRVTDLADAWGSDLLHFISVRGRDARVLERYQKKLGLQINELGRLFGAQVLGEVGVVAFDPFLREGTDLAVLLKAKSSLLFSAFRNTRFAELLAQGAQHRSLLLPGGRQAEVYESPGGEIRLFWAQHQGYEVFANGPRILEAVLGVTPGTGTSMGKDPGYRYQRSLKPANSGENAFLFLSDPWIRRLLGPASKTAAARRAVCVSTLSRVEHLRRFQVDFARKTLATAACPGGGAYSLEDREPRCSLHGTLTALTPLSEVPVSRLSRSEAEGYRAFVKRYERYWRGFMDPIGIDVRLDPELEVGVHILPLIQNSVYQRLSRGIPWRKLPLSPPLRARLPDALASLTTRVDPFLLTTSRSWNHRLVGDLKEVLEGSFTLYAHDADLLFLLQGMQDFLGRGIMRRGFLGGPVVAAVLSLNMPLSAEIPLKNPAKARHLLRETLGRVSRWSKDARGTFSMGWDAYQVEESFVYTVNFGPIRFHSFWAVEGDRLLISTKPTILERMVRAVREGTGFGAADPSPVHHRLEFYPGASVLSAPILSQAWSADMRRACFANLGDLTGLAQAKRSGSIPPERELERALGFLPSCSGGGRYRLDPRSLQATCSLHGFPGAARQPKDVPDSPGLRLFKNLEGLSLRLELGEDSLESHLSWKGKR